MSETLNTTPPLTGEKRENPLPDAPSCAQCAREIPHAPLEHRELEDYTRYFCNEHCYEAWLAHTNPSSA